jgi:hypothetical protein
VKILSESETQVLHEKLTVILQKKGGFQNISLETLRTKAPWMSVQTLVSTREV